MRETVSAALEQLGYRAQHAYTFADARHLLTSSHPPALVLSHYATSSASSGPELIQATLEDFPNLPMIILSSRPKDELSPAPERWVFLSKPFGVQELLTAVHAANVSDVVGK